MQASKAAVLRFYETLRAELSPDIKVTIATPGYVESELTKGKLMLKEGQIKVDKEARDVRKNKLILAVFINKIYQHCSIYTFEHNVIWIILTVG